MSHSFIDFLIEKAKSIHGRVAVPDAQFDERVLRAAYEVHKQDWLNVVLVGSEAAYHALAARVGMDIGGMEIIDPDRTHDFHSMCDEYKRLRAKENLTDEGSEQALREPNYFACMLHRRGMVDGVCAGVHYSTADTARAAIKILGTKPGVSKVTTSTVMAFEHTPLGDNLVYCAADCAILPLPTREELAEIAILAADNAAVLLPEPPRVAMISFSTQGSARHEMVDKVTDALALVRERRPEILIDGEFQIDSAISPFVASKKVKRPSEVAGRANVLIWPDVQSGNIGSKAMMLMGNGVLVGATFLGLNGLVGDHSRGATLDEVRAYIVFIGAQVEDSGKC